MTDKVLGPWCGAEMEHAIYNDAVWCTGNGEFREAYHAFYRCRKCGAQGPVEYRSHGPAAEEAARAAAMRRHTPPIKPMTFEEVERLACSDSIDDEIPLYLEDIDGDNGWEISYQLRRLCFNAKDDYGKTWRCWERMPTKEERSAAEWEET